MKKMNKKGFTITELVIVIAVIAILAGVMIPTFSGIIKTAQESAEMQKVTAAYKEAYGIALSDNGEVDPDDFTEETTATDDTAKCIKVDKYEFTYADGVWSVANASGFTYTFAKGAWTVTKV